MLALTWRSGLRSLTLIGALAAGAALMLPPA